MFDVTKIQNGLVRLVGFRQPINPAYAIIDSNNQLSDSGLFVNDNPYAKIEYLKDSTDYIDATNEQFNEFITNLKKASVSNICNQVFSNADYIDRNVFYKNAFSKINTENLLTGFYGFRIKVSSEKNVAFKISRVFLDFEGTGDITLILWNNAKLTPLQTKTVTITSDHQEEDLNWIVNNTDATYKGEYYLGILFDQTSGLQPYKRDWENSDVMSYVTYLDIEKVDFIGHNSNILFDITKLANNSETNGLNFDVTVYEDFTDLILNNKFLFSRAIYLDVVISFLTNYSASLRSNRNEQIAKELFQKIMLEIEGTRGVDNVITVKGLRPQLLTEISNIKNEIEKIKEGYFGIGYNVITED